MVQLESIIEFNRRYPDVVYAGVLDDTEFYNDPIFDWVRPYTTASNLGPIYVDFIRKLYARSQQVGLPLELSCMQGAVLNPPDNLTPEGGLLKEDYELLFRIVLSPLQVQAYGNTVQYIKMRLREAASARQDNGEPVPLELAAEFQHPDLIGPRPNKETITLYPVTETACDTLKEVCNAHDQIVSVDLHTSSGKAVAELLRRLQWPCDPLTAVTVNPSNVVPEQLVLHHNYPNPFNPSTTIAFELPKVEKIELTIYNTLGQKVKTLVNGRQPAGTYLVQWDGRDSNGKALSSGVYLYRAKAGTSIQTRKMVLLR